MVDRCQMGGSYVDLGQYDPFNYNYLFLYIHTQHAQTKPCATLNGSD